MSVLQGGVYAAQVVAGSALSGATVTCTVTAPDGTQQTYTGTQVTVASATASVNIPASLVGTYVLLWTFTGTVVGAVQDQFTVDPVTADLISLPDLKEELNLDPADGSKDSKLRRYLRAATSTIENVTGPIRAAAQTDVFDGGVPTLLLSATWVSSITSVVETSGITSTTLTEQPYGVYGTVSGYTWDRRANILRRVGAYTGTKFAPGLRNVTVNYIAGMTTIPDDIQRACAVLVSHWYRQGDVASRTGTAWGAAGGDEVTVVGNYQLPNGVMELLERWQRPHGIA